MYPRPSRHPSGPNHPSVSTSYVAVGAWGLQPLVAMSSFYVGCGDPNSGPTVYWQAPYPPSHLSNPRNGLSLAIWNFLNQVRLRASTHHLPRSAFLGKGCSEPPVDSTTRSRPSENAPRGCWEPRTQLMWAVTMESRVERRDRNTSVPLSSAYVILNKRSGHFLLPEDTFCSVNTESSASPFCG